MTAQVTLSDDAPPKATASQTPAPSAPPAPPPPTLEPPQPIDVRVAYPPGGEGRHTVVVEVAVGADGFVHGVSVVRGPPLFSDAALQQAKGWRFRPATRDGVPVAARLRFAVDFEPAPEAAAADSAAIDSSSPSAREAPSNTSPQSKPGAETPPPGEPNPSRTATAGEDDVVEVLVVGERKEAGTSLDSAEVRELPGAFGDAFRAIEVLPGVVPIASGLPYFYVRGAPPGNVGYFFDGVRVPVLFHFAAGPAILHPAFVGRVDLYPGAYPARYGRYAGAIVAGEMEEPEYRLRGEASIRLVDSGAMIEAPFLDGQGSVMAGARISYTGLLLSLLSPEVDVRYWDYQSRSRVRLDDDDSVEVLVFGSGDFVSGPMFNDETGREEETTLVDIGFHRLDVRWDRDLVDGRLRNAVTLGYDRTGFEDGQVELTSTLFGARSELERQLDPENRLSAGVDVLFERLQQNFDNFGDEIGVESAPPPMFDQGAASPVEGAAPPVEGAAPPLPPTEPPPPSDVQLAGDRESSQPGDEDFDLGFGDRTDFTAGAYADVVMDLTPGVEFTPGLRADVFVSRGDVAVGVDPRLRVRYQLAENFALIHALGLAHQMPSFPIPIPGITPSLKGGLQRALQHSVTGELQMDESYSLTMSVFQSAFFNMTDLIGVPDAASQGFRSIGHAYGFEAMFRRSLTRKLGGFVSYTLSRSERALGRYGGPSGTDRTHVLNAALSYDLGRNWRFGNRFMFYTGLPAILGTSEPDPSLRTTPFWRVDWRLQKRWLNDSGGYWGVIFEVLNTTLNEEVISIHCDDFGCGEDTIGPVTIPSIGVEGAF